jgi:uncharacterized protein YbaP (TraB family)
VRAIRPLARGLAALALLALAGLAGSCGAQGRALDLAQPTGAGPALWRLSDADSEIWLFGTVHILPPDLKWRTERIDRAFAGAETIWFETPTDPAAQDKIAGLVSQLGLNPPGETLTGALSAADRARFQRIAASLKLDAAALERVRPWLAAIQITLAFVTSRGHDPKSGVETVLEAEAARLKKPTRYFETAEEQIRFLADLPPAVQANFLSATLRQIEEDGDTVQAMDAAWVAGDVKALEALLTRQLEEAGPEVYAALISDRNARWAKEIDAMMQGKGKVFIAVGAAHLSGKDSVQSMLRAKGYEVEGP